MNAATETKPALFVGQAVRDMYHNGGFIYKIENDDRGMFTLGSGKIKMRPITQRVHIVFTGDNPHTACVGEDQAARYVAWRGPAEPATSSQLAEYISDAETHQANARTEQHRKRADDEQRRALFLADAQTKVPPGAKAVLIAQYRVDDSDIMIDYFASHSEQTLILGFSNHTRDLFPEMRKAAANAPETAFLVDAPGDYEHREKYSQGAGYYLGKNRYSGWFVKKVPLYDRGAAGVPVGEWRLPAVEASARAPVQTGQQVTVTSGPGFTIEEHTHTKKGFQMFIVILADRVARDEYERILRAAQDIGGWYSRPWGKTPGGFAFKQQQTAQDFAAEYVSGSLDDIPQSAMTRPEVSGTIPCAAPGRGEKLRMLAEGMRSDIDNKLGDRLENTPKRAAQGAHARLEAYKLQRAQQVLFRLADLYDAGHVPLLLSGITSKSAVLEHMSAKTQQVQNGFHSYSIETVPLTPIKSDPITLALWALLDAPDPRQAEQDELKRKVNAVKLSGSIPGYFPTPPAVVAEMMNAAQVKDYHTVLEPSAGDGAILAAIPDGCLTVAFEINHTLCDILKLRGFDMCPSDFLEQQPGKLRFDRVLMNPPFENQQDIAHVLHAFQFLKPGGRLVAIMSPGWQTRNSKQAEEFRAWFEQNRGLVVALPAGSFRESGTGASTVMIIVDREEM
jgi:hypothetical protein